MSAVLHRFRREAVLESRDGQIRTGDALLPKQQSRFAWLRGRSWIVFGGGLGAAGGV
jgi:hypothetical protein